MSAFHLQGAWDTPTLEHLERDANGVMVDVYSNSPAGDELQSRLFVTGDKQNAERVIRAFVVNSERTDISVTTLADHAPKEPRAVAWIMASIKIAATGAFLALLLSVSTSASQSAKTRLRLIALGARLGTIGAAGLAGLTSATQINPANAHQALNNPD
ncbi:MAG: hypothetical protein GY713_13795 [Actinomycetia bacterium]|nr:hypothetical protein [Actinomycetes bacterium]